MFHDFRLEIIKPGTVENVSEVLSLTWF